MLKHSPAFSFQGFISQVKAQAPVVSSSLRGYVAFTSLEVLVGAGGPELMFLPHSIPTATSE